MVRSKLSPSGDVAIQTVAFARRFADFFITFALALHSFDAGVAAMVSGTLRARMTLLDALVRI
jgi:hypothetical protein